MQCIGKILSFKHARKNCCVYLWLRQGDEETDVSDCSDREEVESIGETLFNAVHQLDPNHCADITGELLCYVEFEMFMCTLCDLMNV